MPQPSLRSCSPHLGPRTGQISHSPSPQEPRACSPNTPNPNPLLCARFWGQAGCSQRDQDPLGHSTSPPKPHTAHPHLTTLSPTPQLAGPRTWAWRWEKQGTSQRGPLAYFPRHFFFFCFIFSRIHHMKKFKLLPRLKREQKQRPAGGEGGTAAPFLRPRSRRGARHKGNGAAKPSQNNPTCPSSRCSPAASFSPDPKTQNKEVVVGGNGP